MRYYADVESALDIQGALALAEDLARPLAGTPGAVEYARRRLIDAGMIEQARADADPAGDGDPRLAALTDAWATRLARAMMGTPSAARRRPADMQARIGALSGLTARDPEGYLFYGLFPDLYLRTGQRLGAALGGGSAVVIGVRSIGASLSAAVMAGMRRQGIHPWRATVRPTGDPFDREVVFSAAPGRAIRRAAERGAAFVAVDEGPGLSGSSLAATVRALERHGIPPERLHIVCAQAGPMPMAGPATRAVWERVRVWEAQGEATSFWQATLPTLLGQALGMDLAFARDLSWGAWAEAEAPLLPHLERRKLLLRAGDQLLIAKFIGLGEMGERKAALARQLSAARLVPPVLGYSHGMLLQRWLPGAHPRAGGHDNDALLPAVARYYAFLRRHCASTAPPALDELAATVRGIAADWLGAAPPLEPLPRAAAASAPVALDGDQRPDPVEWLQTDGGLLKCDAADHFLDHTWARRQDVCFDLAGLSLTWALTREQERALLEAYVAAGGDSGVWARMGLYRAVYAAHRLAALDTAYHAKVGSAGTLDAARQAMGRALADALWRPDAVPCAS